MRNLSLAFLLIASVAGLAGAAEPPAEPAATSSGTFVHREIEFGLLGPESDTNSSRFLEYRDLPSGFVLPTLRFAGNGPFWYDVIAEDVLQEDARYWARLEPGPIGLVFEYGKIPHRFGNDARTLLERAGSGAYVISNTLQSTFQSAIEAQRARSAASVNFAFLNGLVTPSLQAAESIDLALSREKGRVELQLGKDKPIGLRLAYSQEHRRGTRAAGTAFGFGNVVESPEPIEYRTHDFLAQAELSRTWGTVTGRVQYNWFRNDVLSYTFDNPFRITDSTDASAYQAPGSASIGGAAVGLFSLPPDNQALTGGAGALFKLPGKTRVTVDASLSRWTQDSPFIPFTSNTAITTPIRAADPATLPNRSLDGKIDVLAVSASVVSRPIDRLRLTARLRRYDLDNKTPRIEFDEGYVRFDGVWEDIPRISVPYGFKNDDARLTASYDLGPAELEAGFRHLVMDRTFRETEETKENAVNAALRVKPAPWALLRASVETGSREFDEYDAEHSEHASFLEPGPPANLLALRRYDQANKDFDRASVQAQLTPGGKATLGFAYTKGQEEYTESDFGLISADTELISVDLDVTPNERVTVFGYYSRENLSSLQQARQSGASLSVNPADNWTSTVTDTVDTVGGGAVLGVVKDKLNLRLDGSYQKVDGNNDLESPPGGTPDVATDIPLFDDTKRTVFLAELSYNVTSNWKLALGGWYEQYELQDSNTSALPNYTPGSFFLSPSDADYKAHVVYARAQYIW